MMVEVDTMEDSVVKRVDPQGRISIPMEWRADWKSESVLLVKQGDRIELRPIEPVAPSALFDSIAVTDTVDLSDSHSLKKALLESPRI